MDWLASFCSWIAKRLERKLTFKRKECALEWERGERRRESARMVEGEASRKRRDKGDWPAAAAVLSQTHRATL